MSDSPGDFPPFVPGPGSPNVPGSLTDVSLNGAFATKVDKSAVGVTIPALTDGQLPLSTIPPLTSSNVTDFHSAALSAAPVQSVAGLAGAVTAPQLGPLVAPYAPVQSVAGLTGPITASALAAVLPAAQAGTPKGLYNAATNLTSAGVSLTANGGGGAVGDVYQVSVAGTMTIDSVGALAVGNRIQCVNISPGVNQWQAILTPQGAGTFTDVAASNSVSTASYSIVTGASGYNLNSVVTDKFGFITSAVLSNNVPVAVPGPPQPISGSSLGLTSYAVQSSVINSYGFDSATTDQFGFITGLTKGTTIYAKLALTQTPVNPTDAVSLSYFQSHALTSLGGTITGPIDWAGVPSNANDLTNKQYVDTAVAEASGGAAVNSTTRISHQLVSSGAGGILAGYTYHVTYEAEADFDMVRLVFVQDQPTQWSIDNAIVASTASLSDEVTPVDGSGNPATWTTVTFANRGKDGDQIGLAAATDPNNPDMLAQNIALSIAGNGTAGPYTLPGTPLSSAAVYASVGGSPLAVQTLSGTSVTFTTVVASGSTIGGYIVALGTAQSTTTANAATSLVSTDMPTTTLITQNGIVMSDWVPVQSFSRTDVAGARPVLMARLRNVISNLYLPAIDPYWAQQSGGLYPAPPVMAAFRQSGNFATPALASGMTTAAASTYGRLPSCFQIMTRNRGFTVLGDGDSITQGLGIYTYIASTGASASGTTATLLIANASNYWSVGDYIIIKGVSVAGYNVAANVTAVTSNSVSYTLPAASSGLPVGSGGQAGYLVRTFDGWGRRTCAALSKQTLPITWANQAVRGTASGSYIANAMTYIDRLKPQVITLPAYTPNNGTSVASGDLAWTNMMQAYEYALRKGVIPIIFCPVPFTGALGYYPPANIATMGQAILKNLAKARELGASNGGFIIDHFNLLAAPLAGGGFDPSTWNAGLSDDGTHPTDAGHNIIMSVFSPVLQKALGI